MTPKQEKIVLELPAWLDAAMRESRRRFESVEARMRFVIGLARTNVDRRTGGPFAAAVFDAAGALVAVGVNQVETSQCSIWHAEMVAIAAAQRAVGHYDLGADGTVHELVTSVEPCAMCLGAIPWSGLQRVICGARGEEACVIGFDEGAKPPDWVGELGKRGIEVTRDVLREEARAVLQQYARAGGRIYNARRSS